MSDSGGRGDRPHFTIKVLNETSISRASQLHGGRHWFGFCRLCRRVWPFESTLIHVLPGLRHGVRILLEHASRNRLRALTWELDGRSLWQIGKLYFVWQIKLTIWILDQISSAVQMHATNSVSDRRHGPSNVGQAPSTFLLGRGLHRHRLDPLCSHANAIRRTAVRRDVPLRGQTESYARTLFR